MARAKMTGRTEARRRYRALHPAEPASTDREEDAQDETQATNPASSPVAAGSAIRRIAAGIHPPAFREDVTSLPGIVRAKPWILAPYGLLLIGALVSATLPKNENGSSIPGVYVQLAFLQPTLLYFAVGFLAPRAAYLFGALLGLLGAICFAVLALGLVGMFGTLATTSVNDRLLTSGFQFLQFVLTGAVFGWFAAWYRDWLRRSQERSRQQAEARKRQQRRQTRRSEARRAH
ncbi:MAG: hypothetical protein M0Z49_02090 [Chloroflexi bacterium]|nr:hypothetical protein [Chloroflexota bacterium]